MTLPASGPLTFSDIQTEFGGTNPIALNEYYAGGGLVPAGTSGTYGAVPSSGALSVQNFYGTSALIPIYIEEVFQTWLYNGTGSAQTITNGIDFSTNGGLLWFKARNDTRNNWLYDTNRGYQYGLRSDLDFAESTTPDALTAFNNNGFSIGASSNINASGNTLVSWSFRQQPKFFDVVTYTGAGTANPSNISHNLGSTPGFIMIKHYSASGNNWICYHTSLGNTQGIILNGTGGAITSSLLWNNTSPTSSQFTVGTSAAVNGSGSYVAYLFAHNAGGFGATGTDNVISCGSFSTDGSGNATVSLGYEPQWLLIKSTTFGSWWLTDIMRGMSVASGDNVNALFANTSGAEANANEARPNATGFTVGPSGNLASSDTFIYIAIRRGPMKVPTLGTTVFSPVAQAGNGSTQNITTGFPTDLVIGGSRVTGFTYQAAVDRLRGRGVALLTGSLNADDASPSGRDLTSFASNTGFTLGYPPFATAYNYTGNNIYWNFQRAPSYFDVVCYNGNSVAGRTLTHNLGVTPQLIILKARTIAVGWAVYAEPAGNTKYAELNDVVRFTTGINCWNNTSPTASVFSLSSNAQVNRTGDTYVAYLFATCAGVSKVGSYTGTGSLQTINCGFTSGARFVLIKNQDVNGSWYVWDSARGITSGNDPYLLLNSDAAEVTNTNYVDTDSTGFKVTSNAVVNASGNTYIFLAIA